MCNYPETTGNLDLLSMSVYMAKAGNFSDLSANSRSAFMKSLIHGKTGLRVKFVDLYHRR